MKFILSAVALGGLYYYLSRHGSVQAAASITFGAGAVLMLIVGLLKDA